MRQLGVVRSYDDLHQALRARAESLGVPRLVLDEISGLQSGYRWKLLSPTPMKRLGWISLGPLLGALGVRLLVVEDPEMMRLIRRRLGKQPRCGQVRRSRTSTSTAAATPVR